MTKREGFLGLRGVAGTEVKPMDQYVAKALKRIPLHLMAYAGVVGTASYLFWVRGQIHYLLLPGILGSMAAFLKELIENWTITQVWPEFWIDALAQLLGTWVGVFVMWIAVH